MFWRCLLGGGLEWHVAKKNVSPHTRKVNFCWSQPNLEQVLRKLAGFDEIENLFLLAVIVSLLVETKLGQVHYYGTILVLVNEKQ